MNLIIRPEEEFEMMQQFFVNGGTSDEMPEELLRLRIIWKRADELIRKFPYYNNERIANQLIADLPEYLNTLSTAKTHVVNAKKYYDLVETDTPETHKRILTDIAHKQIAALIEQQKACPQRAHQISATIEKWVNRIASINKLYDDIVNDNFDSRDIVLVISDDSLAFPDIPDVTEKELYSTIEKVTKEIDITTAEQKRLIDKDVKGNVL